MEADKKRKRPAEDWEDRRKRRISGGVAGKPRGSGGGGADEAATLAASDHVEDEVEEFFAIVRRMHAAARQFTAGGGQMPRAPEGEGKGFYRWRPAFEWEDFEEEGGHHRLPGTSDGVGGRRGEVASAATSAPIGAAAGRGGKREERPAEDGTAVSLDLNAEPEPEPERVVG